MLDLHRRHIGLHARQILPTFDLSIPVSKRALKKPQNLNMKRIAYLCLALGLLLSACKKDSANYYLRCHIDGVARTFNVACFAATDVDPGSGARVLLTTGFATSDTEKDWIGFWIDNSGSLNDIVAGTYTGTGTDFTLLGTHTDANGHDFEAGTSAEENAVNYSTPIANHFTVTIQSIDDKTIKGTFSGDFYRDADPREAKKSVTNGEFYLKFQ